MNEYHVGYPVDPVKALEQIKRGLPVYWPTDPKVNDQTEYLRFAAKPEGVPK